MLKDKNKIIKSIEKINKLEEGLALFEESDEEYLSVLVKIQGLYDEISDTALECFKEMTAKIRKTGQKRIVKGIDQLPHAIKESIVDQVNGFKGELFE
ncbi:hypothetical protein P4V37_05720 [Bacillus subtilis]|uniref:hypothetical protein n=1 Tax=Bacillales TaxID=1385 RepID=UPI0002E82DE7|nr:MULTISPECIES: hypothetical protein [Bacillales]MBW4824791.1 hypothetical protein [Bacillaceae bacterium]QMV49086.1 hypothetical protein Goe12_c01590 [Bacillus phage vB_BsuS-Goe12]QMV49265.1 hypothetical protein Goe13_c01640 [Bacillus phage vB_BsuS-Goe13]WIT27577.1 hypothetical protein [Bacillus phage SPbetaL5]AOL97839.1 SPBc2 prophage-derived uncharacterized protein YosV [Bacillus subtilis]